MEKATIIGIDLAKRAFQLHGVTREGRAVFRKKVSRGQLLSFMSAHPTAYRQMADSGVPDAIRAIEQRLNAAPARWYIPEHRIAEIAGRIQDGDLIAATSTLPGLDVAHTGIALWQGGRLHLLHAPLVGKAVEISVLPLAQRIVGQKTQDGIMVARVVE